MNILVNANTKVITQGFSGSPGTFHSGQAIAYGTRLLVACKSIDPSLA